VNIGLARRIAFYLADNPVPPTLGDLMEHFGLPKGTAIGERLREARHYFGFTIVCQSVGTGTDKRYVYFMPKEERERVKKTADYREWKRVQREAA
jgi:hypothetical protein